MNELTAALLGVYGLVGVVVAVGLWRAGTDPAAAAAAVVAWPLLIGVRPGAAAVAETTKGPLRDAIDRTFDRLDDAAVRVGGLGPEWREERVVLREALCRADERLAAVDRILADDRDVPAESLARLRERRDRSALEVERVLGDLAELRVQMGLLALAGDIEPLRDGLRGLVARARALDELASLHTVR